MREYKPNGTWERTDDGDALFKSLKQGDRVRVVMPLGLGEEEHVIVAVKGTPVHLVTLHNGAENRLYASMHNAGHYDVQSTM